MYMIVYTAVYSGQALNLHVDEVFKLEKKPYDCVEIFAGKMAISKAFRGHEERAVALDIELDPRDETRRV